MAKLLIEFSILFVFVFIMTIVAFWVKGTLWKTGRSSQNVTVFGYPSQLLTWLKYQRRINTKFAPSRWAKVWEQIATPTEWILIIIWALWLGRHYLVMDSTQWLFGDWNLNVQSYFAWSQLNKCGACVLWNGSFDGGAPLFTDLLAAMAHPLAVIFVVLEGSVNGSKLIGVSGLIIAGLAQWYWGKILRLGLPARLWGAATAVVGGYLIGRLEGGLVEMVFSTASFSLASAAAVHLAESGERRVAIGLGIFTGLAFLSGQGYLELAFILCICPALIILLIDKQFRVRPVWKEFVIAIGIAILVSAILWVPVLHSFSSVGKPGADVDYAETQSIEYQPLNLVIRDPAYYQNDTLGKLTWPSQTVEYIGWIPVLFTFISLRLIPNSKFRLMAFFWITVVLIYTFSSAQLIKWLAYLLPFVFNSLLKMARFPSLGGGLAVPFILALSAWGVDLLLHLKWPNLTLNLQSGTTLRLNLVWLMAILLIVSIKTTYDFVKPWLETTPIPEDAKYYYIVSKIKPETTQWVEPPNGDWGFMIAALDTDIKLTNVYHLWTWKDRTPPPAYVQATRDAIDPSTPNYNGTLEYLSLLSFPDNYYAYVQVGDQKIPCEASAMGGDIDVDCHTDIPGQLVVTENSWTGWSVKQDDVKVPLDPAPWLTTKAPAGTHHYEFRYRPWDVPLGVILSLSGIGISVWLWFRNPKLHEAKQRGTVRDKKRYSNA